MELTVGQGRGYVTVEERGKENFDIGTIAIDAIYTPVVDVGYAVEFTRVGDVTNYEKLTLDVETDGSITPKDAITQAVEIVMDHLRIIGGGLESEGLEKEESPSPEEMAEEEKAGTESAESAEEVAEEKSEPESEEKTA